MGCVVAVCGDSAVWAVWLLFVVIALCLRGVCEKERRVLFDDAFNCKGYVALMTDTFGIWCNDADRGQPIC
jgi:hypothetical protein